MCFRDGVLWIASNGLYRSLDSGQSWNLVNSVPGFLRDVDFLDKVHGLIASNTETYYTSDGGKSFSTFGFGSLSACFGSDTLAIGVAESNGLGFGDLMVSSNGGNSWMSHPSSGQPLCVRRVPASWPTPNALAFFSGGSSGGFLTWTSDKGATWNLGTSGVDWDSYSFAPDSCDASRIYLSHEDAAYQTDKFSKIFLSTDLGNTWQTEAANPEPYFCGSVAAGKEAIYCPSVGNGIFRSLDRGVSWTSINGPSNTTDTRFIAAINDNIIIAADEQGNIWRTDNSGGDSVKLMPGLGTLTLAANSLFASDTISCGDSLIESIGMVSTGCVPPFVASAELVGTDSASYRVASIGLDTITVVFDPQGSGQYRCSLVLTLGDGTTDTVALGGNSVGGDAPLTMVTSDQKTDTIGATVYVPIQFNGLLGTENIDVVMHYAGDMVYDSSVDLLGQKVDVPGEQWSGRSMLHLANVQPGVIAGHALFNVFSDSSTKPVVTFDSVHVDAAGCKYQMPAAVFSTITPVEGCGTNLISELLTTGHIINFSIRPNPTVGDVFLSSSSDLGSATIEIYDMLGTERSQSEMVLTANTPAQLALPKADGMYTIRIRSAAGVFSSRVIVRR